MNYTYTQLAPQDIRLFHDLLKLFAQVFEDESSYQGAVPDEKYLEDFLRDTSHLVLVAENEEGQVIGGLVAYELQKFEQKRRELYVYDLAVSAAYQRRGVATKLFETLKNIARERGAYVIFVQADKVDSGAIAFYRTLRTSEIDAYNFDIEVD
ncbi:MAG: GNAT family N-acetyltransferase [Candidatus Woesebacteria bacterium]